MNKIGVVLVCTTFDEDEARESEITIRRFPSESIGTVLTIETPDGGEFSLTFDEARAVIDALSELMAD